MKLRQLIILAFSIVFSLFILLFQFATKIIFKMTNYMPFLGYTNRHISKIWSNFSQEGNTAICQYIQIIANSSMSLMFAYGIFHYHEHFLQFIIVISHNVHHWFIQFIATDVPDYSSLLQSSYYLKAILCYVYLLFGYLGLSSQIILTVDLIYLFNLPTIVIYKLLAKIYQFLIKYFKIVVEILTIDRQVWLSCPYAEFLLRDSLKVIYIGLLPVFLFLIVVVVFYYLWLTFVIAALKVIMNVSLNLGILLDQLGFLLCLIKGIEVKSTLKQSLVEQANIFYRIEKMKQRIEEVEWVSIFEYTMLIKIFKGNDLLSQAIDVKPLRSIQKVSEILNHFRPLIH